MAQCQPLNFNTINIKFFALSIISSLFILLSSCSTYDREDITTDLNIAGNWKIDHYEIKGKNYPVSGCDVNDQININSDKAGTYIDSNINSSTNECYLLVNIAGKWNLKSANSILELEYHENNMNMMKSFQIDAISNNEIRLLNPGKIIPSIPLNGEVIEVWTKY